MTFTVGGRITHSSPLGGHKLVAKLTWQPRIVATHVTNDGFS